MNPFEDTKIDEAVALLVRAFEGGVYRRIVGGPYTQSDNTDISPKSMTGGRDDLAPSSFRSILRAGALEGSLYVVAGVESDEIALIGLLFGPGRKMFSRRVSSIVILSVY